MNCHKTKNDGNEEQTAENRRRFLQRVTALSGGIVTGSLILERTSQAQIQFQPKKPKAQADDLAPEPGTDKSPWAALGRKLMNQKQFHSAIKRIDKRKAKNAFESFKQVFPTMQAQASMSTVHSSDQKYRQYVYALKTLFGEMDRSGLTPVVTDFFVALPKHLRLSNKTFIDNEMKILEKQGIDINKKELLRYAKMFDNNRSKVLTVLTVPSRQGTAAAGIPLRSDKNLEFASMMTGGGGNSAGGVGVALADLMYLLESWDDLPVGQIALTILSIVLGIAAVVL